MPYVQFSDSTETVVTAVFSCAQNPTEFPNQGEIDVMDSRYVNYKNSVPVFMEAGLP